MAELRSYKRERAISARRLAVELGASGDAVEDWLSGKTRVPGWVLIAIRVKVAA